MEGKQPPKDNPEQRECYHDLFRQYNRRTYGIVFHILRHREAAEDITQEAFVKAFQNIHQLKDFNKFGAWLAVIASNLARNYLKREKRILPFEDIEHLAGSGRDGPEQVVLHNLEIDRIRKAMRDLPPDQYQVIVLQYYYDLKIKEIAELLNIRTGTVKSRLFRARRSLLCCLELKPGNDSLHCKEGEQKNAPGF